MGVSSGESGTERWIECQGCDTRRGREERGEREREEREI